MQNASKVKFDIYNNMCFLIIVLDNLGTVKFDYTYQTKPSTFGHIMICCPFCSDDFIFEQRFLYQMKNVHFP